MKLKLKKLNIYKDKTGSLVPIDFIKEIKRFKIKRIFFLKGNKKYSRANHAHKKCDQIYIPVNGKIRVQTINKQGKKKLFQLDSKKIKVLFVPTFTWTKIFFLDNKSKLLVLCNYKYDKSEYIENFKDLLNH